VAHLARAETLVSSSDAFLLLTGRLQAPSWIRRGF